MSKQEELKEQLRKANQEADSSHCDLMQANNCCHVTRRDINDLNDKLKKQQIAADKAFERYSTAKVAVGTIQFEISETEIEEQKIAEFLRSDEGRAQLSASMKLAEEACDELREKSKVDYLDMLKPMDI